MINHHYDQLILQRMVWQIFCQLLQQSGPFSILLPKFGYMLKIINSLGIPFEMDVNWGLGFFIP